MKNRERKNLFPRQVRIVPRGHVRQAKLACADFLPRAGLTVRLRTIHFGGDTGNRRLGGRTDREYSCVYFSTLRRHVQRADDGSQRHEAAASRGTRRQRAEARGGGRQRRGAAAGRDTERQKAAKTQGGGRQRHGTAAARDTRRRTDTRGRFAKLRKAGIIEAAFIFEAAERRREQ